MIFTRVLKYLRPYWRLAVISGVLILLGALAGLLAPWPLQILIDNVLGDHPPSPLLTFFLGSWVEDRDNRVPLMLFAVIGGVFVTLLQHGLTVLDNFVNTRIDQNMVLDFRSDMFQKAQRLSFSFHDRRRSGRLIYVINHQGDAAAKLVMAIPPLVQSVLTLIGMFIVLLMIHWQMALLSLVIVPFLYYSVGYYIRHIQHRLTEVRRMEAESLSIIHEAISMLRVIVAFGREDHEYRRFRNQGDKTVNARVKLTVRQTLFSLVVDMITALGTALVLGVGAYMALNNDLTVGQLLVVMAYLALVYKPLETISNTVGSFQVIFVALRSSFRLLDKVPDIHDDPEAMTLERAEGAVAFQGVSFNYQSRRNTLRDISFTALPGQVIAIVGPTGAGKTTLISLIPRFYDVVEGAVLLDGHDIRRLTVKSLRDQISIVLQEPLLFSGSIGDNIRYGRLDATMEEIMAAAQAANAHDFIMCLPKQYDTELGERGAQLSGGERQRIAVARAFLKNAPILILDEPTSSIDSKTEAVILDALDRLMIGRTTFMIAHRLSTIRRADLILVMDQGQIVERGTHEELLALGGLYKQLFDMQTRQRGRKVLEDVETPLPPAQNHVQAEVCLQPTNGAISTPRRKKIVLLGMMSSIPVAGAVWGTMHYLLGFQRLGYDVYYVETHGRTPSMLMRSPKDDSSALAVAFIDKVMRRFDLTDHWAFVARHTDGRCYGMSDTELKQLFRDAALIINFHGSTVPLPEHSATGRLIYLETDPVQLEIELYDRDPQAMAFVEPHVAFFSWGLNYGQPDCRVPLPERIRFHPSPPAVIMDLWQPYANGPGEFFTTIANWKQAGHVKYQGEVYAWSKHLEFRKFLRVPRRAGPVFELALSSYQDRDRALLEERGWKVRPAVEVSQDLDDYRTYIAKSRGEFTVAKDQNIRLRSGWFSERSAQYLAAGRPVITQETGFSNVLPTGKGLFGFATVNEVVDAINEINGAYDQHSRAATELAREFFSYDVVLTKILAELDV